MSLAFPTQAARLGNVNHAYSYVALTTAWTAPASCATNIPTIYAGSCDTDGCTTADATDIPYSLYSDGAYVNYPHFTTSGVMTSTACMPPGYEALESFFFTPASACPTGFSTASTNRGSSSRTTVVCCPPNYPTATYFGNDGVYDCYTLKSISAGQPFTVMAEGFIAAKASNVDGWYSETVVSTTSWSTATSATIFHPAINLVVGAGSGSGSGSGSTAANAAFSLVGLGLAASIGILVAIAIGGCCCLACFGLLIRRLVRGKRNKAAAPLVQPAPPVTQYGSPQVQQQPVYGGSPAATSAPYSPPQQQYVYGSPPPQYGYGPK